MSFSLRWLFAPTSKAHSHIHKSWRMLTSRSVDTPAPSLAESRGSFDAHSSQTTMVPDDLFDDSNNDNIIKQEPTETTFPSNIPPATFEDLNSKQGSSQFFDLTQQSAALLCDLQCRSKNSNSPTSAQWWAAFLLYLMTLQLQTSCQTLVLALWTHFPSQTARMISRSMRRFSRSTMTSPLTTSSTTPLLSRSAPAQAQLNAATAAGVSSRQYRVQWMQAYLRARAQAVAARRQHQNGSVCDTTALQQSGRDPNGGLEELDSGVGR